MALCGDDDYTYDFRRKLRGAEPPSLSPEQRILIRRKQKRCIKCGQFMEQPLGYYEFLCQRCRRLIGLGTAEDLDIYHLLPTEAKGRTGKGWGGCELVITCSTIKEGHLPE